VREVRKLCLVGNGTSKPGWKKKKGPGGANSGGRDLTRDEAKACYTVFNLFSFSNFLRAFLPFFFFLFLRIGIAGVSACDEDAGEVIGEFIAPGDERRFLASPRFRYSGDLLIVLQRRLNLLIC